MKDQKSDDQDNRKLQKPGQPLANTNKPPQDTMHGHHDKIKTQRLRTGEDQNFRSANNDTLGIP